MSKKPSDATLLRAERRMRSSLEDKVNRLTDALTQARYRLGQSEDALAKSRAEADSWKEVATNLSRFARDSKPS